MARAPGEEAGIGVFGPRERAIRDSVVIHVAVPSPAVHPIEIFGGEYFAPIEDPFGIRQRRGHPRVHPEVEIREHQDRGLQPIGEIERLRMANS